MKTLKFKTSLKCGGCVETVTPALNSVKGIVSWEFDLESPDRILTVITDTASADEIVEAVKQKGYKIEEVTNN